MKKETIVRFGDPVLRETAQPVRVFHKKFLASLDAMKYTLLNTDNGAALAANQVAFLKRVVVINYMDEYLELINPEIIASSGEQIDYEGCLSLPGYFGNVKRAETVTVKYLDRTGKEVTIERTGKMARCIQHEVDHLNGILFIDRMDEKFVVNDEDESQMEVAELQEMTRGVKG